MKKSIVSTLLFLCLAGSSASYGDNQTPDFTPLSTAGLPFLFEIVESPPVTELPTLQSFVYGVYEGQWLLIAGRTNGLHNFTSEGLENFPPRFQNTNLFVFDPVTRQVWSRSLDDPDAGIAPRIFNALSSTAAQFLQEGSVLYVCGGYLYDGTTQTFKTYDTLTALDLPGVVSWVKAGAGMLSPHVRQTSDPVLQVTGGEMFAVNGEVFLVFGQNFDGPYTPGANGEYTQQLRTFSIVDNGLVLAVENIAQTSPEDAFRRRDMNIVPIAGPQGTPAIVALSGVFTPSGGAWTVPVEISEEGTLTMADPESPQTFKQGMNGYTSPNTILYSRKTGQNFIALFGGISLVTNQNGTFVADDNLPFTSQASVVVRNPNGVYSQSYLGNLYPNIPNGPGGSPLLFGASARLIEASDLPRVDSAIDLDAITARTKIGTIFGGIAANIPNFGTTAASNLLFDVWVTPAQPAPTPSPIPPIPPIPPAGPAGPTEASGSVIDFSKASIQAQIENLSNRMIVVQQTIRNPRARTRQLQRIRVKIRQLQAAERLL